MTRRQCNDMFFSPVFFFLVFLLFFLLVFQPGSSCSQEKTKNKKGMKRPGAFMTWRNLPSAQLEMATEGVDPNGGRAWVSAQGEAQVRVEAIQEDEAGSGPTCEVIFGRKSQRQLG